MTNHPSVPQELLSEAEKTFPTSSSSQSENQRVIISGFAQNKSETELFAFHQHTYVTTYIKLADQKAAVLFTISIGLLCYLFKNNLHKLWFKLPFAWGLLDCLCFIGIIGLVIGLSFAIMVVVPRLKKSHRGLVFFGSVNEFESSTEYASEILASKEPSLTKAILKHTYDLSAVCSAKYDSLFVSIWSTCIGVIFSLFVLLLK